ncbi:MAG: ABC transporter permease/M1 family aminopeptidase, partial [Salibacteraceae bacterium]
AFFNNASLRDYSNQFHEILYSTPLNKSGFFFGRFLGALLLATVPLIGIFIGIALGSWIGPVAGWIPQDRVGPLFLETFLNNYLLFVVPNMLFAGSIIFALANKWKSTVISFVGTLLIIIGYIISGTLMSDIENETIAALVDPFGIRSYSIFSQYWTPAEKNVLSPSFSGVLLANRLIWLLSGVVILMVSYFSFSFREKNKTVKKQKEDNKSSVTFTLPTLNSQFGTGYNQALFVSFFRINFLSILKSTTFIILFLFATIILVTSLMEGFEYYGLQSFPVTYDMVNTISGASGIFVLIILVFFSGELIWRDRDSHINEVIDSTPHTSFISLFAKTLSLLSITILLHFFFVVIGVMYQLGSGYTNLELDLYLSSFILKELPGYFVWSCIFIFIQVMVNQKYIAFFSSVLLIFVLDIAMFALDIQSNMLSINGAPSLQYSDMNSFGPGLKGALWFKEYWALLALLLLLVSGFMWNRGTRAGFGDRLSQFKVNFKGTYAMVTVIVFACWLGTASFIYYNTQILNEYDTRDEREQQAINYEKKYSKYKNTPRPKVAAATYFIDIYPEDEAADVLAELKITNTTSRPIDSVHFTINEDWNQKIDFPNSELVFNDEAIGYQIYVLKKSLQPGDTIEMKINANHNVEGFTNDRPLTSVIKNGTFFNNFSVLPSFGYNPSYEIKGKNDRKKHDLHAKDPMPLLTENCSEACMNNYLTDGTADWVNVETFITTSEDQIAIAPGSKISEEVTNGRRSYHYKVDHPSQNFYSFISAKYEVASRKWNGIDLEVYYDTKHPYNVEMMLDALEKSLAYYTTNFGPYYHKQARIIEFPGYSTFAQAFPGTMPYSEAFGFIVDLEGEENNVIDAVIAHEMAHQWWAHQEVSANMQGGTMLTESFAEYSSLMVMKQKSDPMKMTEFLKYDFNRYLRGRSREEEREQPLYKVENQTYIHYGKGSVVLYALQEYIGEATVNAALKEFLDSNKYKAPPYPTSLDFLACLEPRVPDSLKYLIKDWFKEITLYDFRLKEANYSKISENDFEVNIEFEAHKYYADTLGNEIEQPLTEWVDIGVMTPEDDKKLLFVTRIPVTELNNKITLNVESKPGKVVIDPKRLLIERVTKDNSKSPSEK